MTTRQEAIDAARMSAAGAMRINGRVEPMIIGHTGDGRVVVYQLSDWMGSDLAKDIALAAIGVELRKQQAELYVVMTEAWYAPAAEDGPMAGLMPSQRPDRMEALVVSASDREGDTVATYRTVRNANGKFQRFDLKDNTDLIPGMAAKSRFLGLLR
jgi:hypothetical protein